MGKYYEYSQNNSGGSFTKPAITVFIEADSPEAADVVAVKNGLYFDGDGDCECCGDRWYRASEYGVVGDIPECSDRGEFWAKLTGIPAMLVVKKEDNNG